MNRARLLLVLVAVAALVVSGLSEGTAVARTRNHHRTPAARHLVARIRHSTKRFPDIALATDAGYVLFHDVRGKSCIAMPPMGGMGVHFVDPARIADPTLDPRKPEALVYAPGKDGTLRLAAVEYLVDKAAWDAKHSSPPRFFKGRPFNVTGAPNRFGLAAFYSQHVWVWKPNPAGLLAMWNPRVHCGKR